MSKIVNPRMRGKKLTTSFGQFEFNSDGEVEVTEDQAAQLTALRGYTEVTKDTEDGQEDDISDQMETSSDDQETDQPEDAEDTDEDTEDDESELKDDILTEDELDGMTVAQLKKIARDNEIDLNGASKKDEIISVILGAMN